jgi:hypothetical protein
VDLVKDVAAAKNTPLPPKFSTGAVLIDSTDWQDVVFRNGRLTENHINIAGGAEKFLYTLSTGYITQQSIVQDFTNKRVNVRLGLEENIGRVKLGQNVNVRYTRSEGQMANIIDALGMAPYKPIFDPSIIGGYAISSNVEDLNNTGNPLQDVNLNNQVSREVVIYPQVFGEVGIIKGLKFRSQFSATIGNSSSDNYRFPYTASNFFLVHGRPQKALAPTTIMCLKIMLLMQGASAGMRLMLR